MWFPRIVGRNYPGISDKLEGLICKGELVLVGIEDDDEAAIIILDKIEVIGAAVDLQDGVPVRVVVYAPVGPRWGSWWWKGSDRRLLWRADVARWHGEVFLAPLRLRARRMYSPNSQMAWILVELGMNRWKLCLFTIFGDEFDGCFDFYKLRSWKTCAWRRD